MHNLHIYKNGSLPFPAQQFHTPNVQILRAEYWITDVWHHTNLAAPYWRLYWNPDRGAWVELHGHRWPLDPTRLLLIPPRTPFQTRLGKTPPAPLTTNIMRGRPYQALSARKATASHPAGAVRHFFVHFTAGFPYDHGAPHVFSSPVDRPVLTLLRTLTGQLKIDQTHFHHRQTFGLLKLIHHALETVPESYWPHPPDDPRVLQVMRHIDTHFGSSLCNRDFAAMARMNPNAFVRLFKEKTLLTPLDYTRNRRIEKAAILLLQTDRTIEDIAASCGFFDRNHFSRVFQARIGTGPASYRRSRRQ